MWKESRRDMVPAFLFHPKKSQNFLINNRILDKIIETAYLKKNDIVFTDSSTAELQVSSKFNIDKKGNLLIAGNYLNLFTNGGEALAAQLPYFADKISKTK